MNGVRHFRNIFFALAALLWLPVSAHCHLESVPGLGFLHCAAETASAHGSSRDCTDTGCCAAEQSQCLAGQFRSAFPAPNLLPTMFTPQLTPVNVLPAEANPGILTAAPPQLLQTWHFAFRTALPARAPSLAS